MKNSQKRADFSEKSLDHKTNKRFHLKQVNTNTKFPRQTTICRTICVSMTGFHLLTII